MNVKQFHSAVLMNMGCSYNILTRQTNPKDGFMVSLQGTERKVNLQEFSPEHVRQYIKQHRDRLNTDNIFLGAWVDKGTVYLDLSVKIPTFEAAEEMDYLNNQQAIYDNTRKKVIELQKI